MAGMVYFDTDVFHRVADAFQSTGLRADLRDRIALSPITITEVLSQLTVKSGVEILNRIHSLLNIVNREGAHLLPWMDTAIAKVGFGVELADKTTDRLARAVNVCLQTGDVDELKVEAGKLKDLLDNAKSQKTNDFCQILEAYRRQPLSNAAMRDAAVKGLARRVGIDPATRPIAEVVTAMSAYFEFEETRLKEAASNPGYKPEKHMNDLLDVEQLIYLQDTELHFLTCDTGYLQRVLRSPQRACIREVRPEDLKTCATVEGIIEEMSL